jgi:hypothetical protein
MMTTKFRTTYDDSVKDLSYAEFKSMLFDIRKWVELYPDIKDRDKALKEEYTLITGKKPGVKKQEGE